jgi:hypothetical protein
MYDRELAREILTQIHHATQTVLERFAPIKSADDFTSSDSGMEKLDSICMQLISIGEGLKNLDKITGNTFLLRYNAKFQWDVVAPIPREPCAIFVSHRKENTGSPTCTQMS